MRWSTDSEIVEEEAACWFARCVADTWTAAERDEFEEWLEKRTAHRIAYLRLITVWDRVARMRALAAGESGNKTSPRAAWGGVRFSTDASPAAAGFSLGDSSRFR